MKYTAGAVRIQGGITRFSLKVAPPVEVAGTKRTKFHAKNPARLPRRIREFRGAWNARLSIGDTASHRKREPGDAQRNCDRLRRDVEMGTAARRVNYALGLSSIRISLRISLLQI